MGFWDRLFGRPEEDKPKKKMRGPSRSAAEREKIEQIRFLRRLEKNDPVRYEELMAKRLGLGSTDKDELAQLQTTVKKLRELGLIKSAGDIDSGAGWIKDAVAGLGMFLQMQAQAQQQAREVQIPPPPVATPAAQPQIASPSPQNREEEPMDMLSMYVVSQLKGKSPEQAAAWLASQSHPQAQAFVRQLCQTSDGEIFGFLAQLGQAAPGWQGAVAWLTDQGELWVLSAVKELRRLTGQGSSAPAMGF